MHEIMVRYLFLYSIKRFTTALDLHLGNFKQKLVFQLRQQNQTLDPNSHDKEQVKTK